MFEWWFLDGKGEKVQLEQLQREVQHLDEGFYNVQWLPFNALIPFMIREKRRSLDEHDVPAVEAFSENPADRAAASILLKGRTFKAVYGRTK